MSEPEAPAAEPAARERPRLSHTVANARLRRLLELESRRRREPFDLVKEVVRPQQVFEDQSVLREKLRRGLLEAQESIKPEKPSLRALARESGLSPATMSRIFSMRLLPTPSAFGKLLNELDRRGVDHTMAQHLKSTYEKALAYGKSEQTADQARSTADPDLTLDTSKPQLVAQYVCEACGAVVLDPGTHNEWHQSVSDVVRTMLLNFAAGSSDPAPWLEEYYRIFGH